MYPNPYPTTTSTLMNTGAAPQPQPQAQPQPQMSSLNSNPGGAVPPPQYRHGGMVGDQMHSAGHQSGHSRRGPKMVKAHFSPVELDVLDHFQGERETHGPSGMRSFRKLDGVIGNPHISSNLHHHCREQREENGDHLAHGGMPHHFQHPSASFGRHGDTEMALIGPHLRHFLDAYAGKKTQNPHDGEPEYFSLSGLFSGMMPALKGIGSAMAPQLGGMAASALLGPEAAQMGAQRAGELANKFLGPQGAGAPQPAYDGKANPWAQLGGAAMQGLGHHLQQSQNPKAQGMGQAMQEMAQGNGVPSSMSKGLTTAGYTNLANPGQFVKNQMTNMASNVASRANSMGMGGMSSMAGKFSQPNFSQPNFVTPTPPTPPPSSENFLSKIGDVAEDVAPLAMMAM